MRSHLKFDEESPRTTGAHLIEAVDCWNRVEVLVALTGPTCGVGELAKALGFSVSLLSNHLRELRRFKLVVSRTIGKRHEYELGPHARVNVDTKRATIRLSADDGCTWAITIPRGSEASRLIVRGLAWADRKVVRVATRANDVAIGPTAMVESKGQHLNGSAVGTPHDRTGRE